ncbi:MAG: YebC/PmpR family DNA-binding transcriptional regulator, partial [Candidatus Eisenbacteria bacterium]|nr:YebC/PmpR family DNA-binding transcriptional regulator [Candidatus Eisenbacteria bacterium]
LLSKHGGNLGEAGCVAWMFQTKGMLRVDQAGVGEERLMEAALDAGAEDVDSGGDGSFEIYTATTELEKVQKALEQASIPILGIELARVPTSNISLDEKSAEPFLRLLEALEDHDDVQKVYSNFDIPDELMEKLRG